MAAPTCLRCQSRMEIGYIVDESYGTRTVGHWIEGAPEKSLWAGLKTGNRRKLEVETWRCTRCGWLDSYAAS